MVFETTELPFFIFTKTHRKQINKKLTATQFNIWIGFEDARPIRKYSDPG